MFRIPSIVKTPKHRRFDYKTRYYDAEKEAFNERVRKAEREAGKGASDTEALKMRVHKQYENRRNSKTLYSARQSNFRIMLIIGLLGALLYWILK